MNTTGITLPLITQIPNCTLKDCRTRIADNFSANRSFYAYQVAECKNCPAMTYSGGTIGPSTEWKKMWLEYNFFIKNSIGQDCEKNPIKGGNNNWPKFRPKTEVTENFHWLNPDAV